MRLQRLAAVLVLVAVCLTMSACAGKRVDLSGRWIGTWVGTGLFNSPREDDATLDFTHRGKLGYGRLVLEGTTAAESVPQEIRWQGLNGIRVVARISGSKITLTHELGSRLFTADLKVTADRMVGVVRGTSGVRLLLTRAPQKLAPETARALPAAPATAPPAPPRPVPPPVASEPPSSPEPSGETVAVVPETVERTRPDDLIAVPELRSVYFDYNKAVLRPDARDILTTNAEWLKQHRDAVLVIEGHCDERGTPEYNVALGERRAKSVMETLAASGIPRDRMTTVSYGKERPACNDGTERCMNLNRRAEFRVRSR